jgi:cobalt-zinc-cadmium efflux system outer membrane protein
MEHTEYPIKSGKQSCAARTGLGLVTVMLSMGLCACAARPTGLERPSPRALGNDLPVYEAPKELPLGGPVAEFKEPRSSVTLRQALSFALLNNPELAAFSWEIRAREAQELQAGLRLNPEFGVEVENFGGSGSLSGFEGSEVTISLGQLIELGGKRSKRAKVASLERDLASWDYESRRMDVFAEVAKSFFAVLSAQEQVALAESLSRIAERATETVAERVRAGAASSVDRTRAQVASATATVERNRVTRALAIARNRLAALWSTPEATFSEAVGELEAVRTPPSLTDLMRRVVNNPELARWMNELEQRRALVAAEEANGIPNVFIAGGFRRLNDEDNDAFVAEVSVPLPLFDRNQGAAQAARYRLAKAKHEFRAEEVAIRNALAEGYEMLAAAFEEVVSLRVDVLPLAEEAFQSAENAYLRGRFRYLEVLDTQRTLFELRGRYVAALAAYHSAAADIERLIGEPLDAATPTGGRP